MRYHNNNIFYGYRRTEGYDSLHNDVRCSIMDENQIVVTKKSKLTKIETRYFYISSTNCGMDLDDRFQHLIFLNPLYNIHIIAISCQLMYEHIFFNESNPSLINKQKYRDQNITSHHIPIQLKYNILWSLYFRKTFFFFYSLFLYIS